MFRITDQFFFYFTRPLIVQLFFGTATYADRLENYYFTCPFTFRFFFLPFMLRILELRSH